MFVGHCSTHDGGLDLSLCPHPQLSFSVSQTGLLRIISVGLTTGPHPSAHLCPGAHTTLFPSQQLGLGVPLPGRSTCARGCPGRAGSGLRGALQMQSTGALLRSELGWGPGTLPCSRKTVGQAQDPKKGPNVPPARRELPL